VLAPRFPVLARVFALAPPFSRARQGFRALDVTWVRLFSRDRARAPGMSGISGKQVPAEIIVC
jgi:hypothetical protein